MTMRQKISLLGLLITLAGACSGSNGGTSDGSTSADSGPGAVDALGGTGASSPDPGALAGTAQQPNDAAEPDATALDDAADAALAQDLPPASPDAAPDQSQPDVTPTKPDAAPDVVAMCRRIKCDCTFKGKKL